MKTFVPLALLLMGAAQPALAQTATNQPATAKAPTINPLDKVVCRTEQMTGSRFSKKRICQTAREWLEQAEANRLALERLQQLGQATR